MRLNVLFRVGLATTILGIFGLFSVAQVVHAQQDSTQLDQVCQGNVSSPICQEIVKNKSDEVTGIDKSLRTITNYVAYLGGVIAVIIMVISGISLITSGGDSGKVANARNSIIYAAAGIVAIIFARALVLFIIDAVG